MVGPFGSRYLLSTWLGLNRCVANDLAVFEHRHGIHLNPVIIAVLAAVLDRPSPGLSTFDGAPEIDKRLNRHVRMTHDVLRRADQLFIREPADVNKILIDIGDISVHIFFRYGSL